MDSNTYVQGYKESLGIPQNYQDAQTAFNDYVKQNPASLKRYIKMCNLSHDVDGTLLFTKYMATDLTISLGNYLILNASDIQSIAEMFERNSQYLGKDVAEFGAGMGIYGGYLAFRHPEINVTCVDQESTSLITALKLAGKAKLKNLTIKTHKIGKDKPWKQFDSAFGICFLELNMGILLDKGDREGAATSIKRIAHEIHDLLLPGSYFQGLEIIGDPYELQLIKESFHEAGFIEVSFERGVVHMDVDTPNTYSFVYRRED